MSIRTGMHASDQANIIHDFRSVRQQFGKLGSALPMRLEPKGASKELLARLVHETKVNILFVVGTAVLRQLWLRIGKVHVRRTTVLEQGDHRLGLGLEMRPSREQVIVRFCQGDGFRLLALVLLQ